MQYHNCKKHWKRVYYSEDCSKYDGDKWDGLVICILYIFIHTCTNIWFVKTYYGLYLQNGSIIVNNNLKLAEILAFVMFLLILQL